MYLTNSSFFSKFQDYVIARFQILTLLWSLKTSPIFAGCSDLEFPDPGQRNIQIEYMYLSEWFPDSKLLFQIKRCSNYGFPENATFRWRRKECYYWIDTGLDASDKIKGGFNVFIFQTGVYKNDLNVKGKTVKPMKNREIIDKFSRIALKVFII